MAHLAPLQRPLRLLQALAFAAVLTSLPVSAETAAAPSAFAIAEPLVGDEWTYAVHHHVQNGSVWEPATPAGYSLVQRSFEQSGPGVLRDPAGDRVGVSVLREQQLFVSGDSTIAEEYKHGLLPSGEVV